MQAGPEVKVEPAAQAEQGAAAVPEAKVEQAAPEAKVEQAAPEDGAETAVRAAPAARRGSVDNRAWAAKVAPAAHPVQAVAPVSRANLGSRDSRANPVNRANLGTRGNRAARGAEPASAWRSGLAESPESLGSGLVEFPKN